MMQTIFKNKIMIAVVVILLVMVVGYFAIKGWGGNKSTSGVTKQPVTASAAAVANGQAIPGQEFITQLLAIQNISINLALFNDPVYASLQDFSREIAEQPISRPNPFAPVDFKSLTGENALGENPGIQIQSESGTAGAAKKPATGSGSGSTSGGSGLFKAVE